jgi:hypothetical protein
MEKFEIAPCVIVYRDPSIDIVKLYDLLKKYQKENNLYFNPTELDVDRLNESTDKFVFEKNRNMLLPWGNVGKRIYIPFLNEITKLEEDSEAFILLKSIYNSYIKIYEDYVNEHFDCGKLPPFTKRLFNNQMPMMFTLLKQEKKGEALDYVDHTEPDLMQYHVDTFNYDIHGEEEIPKAGARNIATLNTYVNDDYEGGKINFFYVGDPKFKVSYKPKAGDMIMYPSGWPITHGVQKAYGNDRYVLFGALSLFYDNLSEEEINGFIPFNQIYFEEESKEIQEIKNIDGRKI